MARNVKSERKPPLKIIKPARPKPAPVDPLRAAAARVIALMEEMINTNALRLPYPGVIEALADLKRALEKL
jgi:hypothetical protein